MRSHNDGGCSGRVGRHCSTPPDERTIIPAIRRGEAAAWRRASDDGGLDRQVSSLCADTRGNPVVRSPNVPDLVCFRRRHVTSLQSSRALLNGMDTSRRLGQVPRVHSLLAIDASLLVPQRLRCKDATLEEHLERLIDEAALNDAVIRLQASELASARVSTSFYATLRCCSRRGISIQSLTSC